MATSPYNAKWVNNLSAITSKALNDVNWDAYVKANPDALAQWNSNDLGVAAMKAAGWTLGDFGRFHYANDGSRRDVAPYNIYTMAANEKAEADRIAAEEAAKAQATKDARANVVNTARDSALGNATSLLSSYGLNPSKYGGQLSAYFDSILPGLYEGASDPYSALDANKLISNIVTNETNSARTRLSNQVNQMFGPAYGDTLISDNLLDDYINEVLGNQQKTATDYIDRAVARGIYNDQGLSAAQKALQDSYSKGQSQLTSLAGGILDKYQTQANDIGSKASSAASGYTLGSNFSLDPYLKMGQGVFDSATKNARGDLLTALGGQNFFDLSGINLAAGQGQGATGAKDSGIATALADRRKRESVNRGLGSQGAF